MFRVQCMQQPSSNEQYFSKLLDTWYDCFTGCDTLATPTQIGSIAIGTSEPCTKGADHRLTGHHVAQLQCFTVNHAKAKGLLSAHVKRASLKAPEGQSERQQQTWRTPSNRSLCPPEKPRQLAMITRGSCSRSNSSMACAVFRAESGNHT